MNNYDEIRVNEGLCLRIKRFFFVKLKDKIFLKGISTVIGASLLNFIAGGIFSVCQLLLYHISYIHHVNPNNNISLEKETFYYPTEKFTQHLMALICGFIYLKLGLHYTNLIGIGFLFFGYLALLLSKTFQVDIFSMVLCGIGTGIIYYPSTANACEWFMNHNGVVIGIIETMISLGSFFFNILGEKIVGEAEDKDNKNDDFYTKEEGKKFKNFMIYLIIFVLVFYALSFLLTFKKTQDKFTDTKNIQAKLLEEIDSDEGNVINNNLEDSAHSAFDEKQLELISNADAPKKKYEFKKMLITAIKSKELIIFTCIVILEAPLTSTIFSLYQPIGKLFPIKRNVLNSIGPMNFIFECIGGFVFGILCDYVPKKYLLIFIFGTDTIIAYFYCLTFGNSAMFFIFTNLASFTGGGFYSVKDYYLIRVFGVEVYVTIIAYVNFLASILVIALTPLVYHLETNGESNQNEGKEPSKVGYWIIFVIFGTCSIISLVLSLLIKDEAFDYEKKIEEKNIENEQKLITGDNKTSTNTFNVEM